MSHQLSEGSLEVIMNGGHYDKPIMQVLGSKKIQGSGANERFRLLVSDGKHSHSFAMLATQLNDKLISGELSDYSVVQIDRFVTSLLKNTGKGEKRVMIILDITIVSPGSTVGKKLGNPQTWTEESAAAPQASTSSAPRPAPPSPMLNQAPQSLPTPNLDSSLLSSQMTHPISSLSPYQNKKSRMNATQIQINAMIDFISNHPEMIYGVSKTPQGRGLEHRLWTELTINLNSLDGAEKDVKQWKRVWQYRRSEARKEASPSSETNMRILAILGESINEPETEVHDQDDETNWSSDIDQELLECAENAEISEAFRNNISVSAFSETSSTTANLDARQTNCSPRSATSSRQSIARSTSSRQSNRRSASPRQSNRKSASSRQSTRSSISSNHSNRSTSLRQSNRRSASPRQSNRKSASSRQSTRSSISSNHSNRSTSLRQSNRRSASPRQSNRKSASSRQSTRSSISSNHSNRSTSLRQSNRRSASPRWVIKARVMNKSDIRVWNNARGEGKLFSMDLCDETGEIRATAFKNECDKFYDMIQVDKVYYISRCQLKTANKQYTSLKNDYEMTFTANTVVAECMEDSSSVPSVKYEFLPINDIVNKTPDTLLDIIGVCKSAGDVQELTAKSSGKLLKKRDVTLVDNSGGAVALTMWGKEAENFDGSANPVIAVKGARLTEFNGSKSLGCLASTMIRQNPDLPEAHKLRGWYDNGGSDMEIVNISARAGGYSGGSSEWISFSDAEARQLGSGEKGDFYSLLGVLTFTFADNAVYKACPQEQCNKKLVDQENGLYRCEKCNREYPNYKYRLLLAANVSDPTGDQRITAFNEAAEAMLGRNVAEIGQMYEYDKTAYTQMFEEVKFKTFVFKFRTKMETYNDEARLKTTVMNVQPVDFKDANKRLIASIKTITGIEV